MWKTGFHYISGQHDTFPGPDGPMITANNATSLELSLAWQKILLRFTLNVTPYILSYHKVVVMVGNAFLLSNPLIFL